eukprot:s2924_g2.t1
MWAKRLKAIADRAGEHSGHEGEPEADGILSHEEKSRLRLLVFTSGAPSTMSNHIRRFEKFELWAQRMQISFYPITDEKILKYAVELDARECLDLFDLQSPLVERDFWVSELDTRDRWRATPPDYAYARSLQWLHRLV